MTFSKEALAKIKNSLQQEKEKLEEELRFLSAQSHFGNDIDGFDEETDEVEELMNEKGAEFMLKEKLQAIHHAIEKIEHGSYGICEQCGKEIEKEVLDFIPESSLCKSCKQNT